MSSLSFVSGLAAAASSSHILSPQTRYSSPFSSRSSLFYGTTQARTICSRLLLSEPLPASARSKIKITSSLEVPKSDFDYGFDNVIDISEDEGQRMKTKRESTKTLDMLFEIENETGDDAVTPLEDFPPVDEDELAPFCRTVVKAADKRKCIDPLALRVSPWTFVTSFLVIVSGKNLPQVRAIANTIEEDALKIEQRVPERISGSPNSGWVLLDCKLPPF